MSRVEKFEGLLVWQNGLSQAIHLYKQLASCSDYGLRDQMQRLATSVPSNIAEGFERHTNRKFIRCLRIAKGSDGELRTQIHLAIGIGLRSEKIGDELLTKSRIISAILQNLIKTSEAKFI